jgi:ABC-2 type transport system permease protein
MSPFLQLLAYSLKRVRTLVVALSALLAVFQVFLIVVARSIQGSGSFERLGDMMPPFVRELLGPSFISFMSFSGIVCLGYFHLAVMGGLIGLAIALGTMPTSEIEIGFTDLILSRPLARHWLITRSIVLMVISSVIVLAMMVMGTWLGLVALAPVDVQWPTPGLIASLVVNLALLMLCWHAIALALGARSRRRATAGGLAGLLALTMFLLDYVARAWDPARVIAWASPFRYYSPFDMLTGQPLSTTNLVVLAGISLAGLILAYLAYARRDLSH